MNLVAVRDKPDGKRSVFAIRFGIRTLLLGMTVVCLLFGAWSIYVNPYREQAKAVAWVRKLGGTVEERAATGPDWQRFMVQAMVGEQSFTIAHRVDLRNTSVPANQQTQFGYLIFTEELILDRSAISDRAIAALTRARHLKRLSLRYTSITDQGLIFANRIPSLKTLRVTGTEVGDAGLQALAEHGELKELFIRWTNISAEAAELFRQANPDCKLHFHLRPQAASAM